jgi:hypothetical protein
MKSLGFRCDANVLIAANNNLFPCSERTIFHAVKRTDNTQIQVLAAMQMDTLLKLIDDKNLCLCDKDGNVLAKHKPLWTKFDQFKRIRENCNIVKESDQNFPELKNDVANIYCLDDNFNVKWTIKAPYENDTFPNPIVWDTEMIEKQTAQDFLTLNTNKNPETFICSSWHGFTVTVDYETGLTKSVEFTK